MIQNLDVESLVLDAVDRLLASGEYSRMSLDVVAREAGVKALVFFFMRWVVVPLSAAPHFKSTPLSDGSDFLVHVFLIGLPIGLFARRYAATRSDAPGTG